MENKQEFCARLGFALRCSRENIKNCEYEKKGSKEFCHIHFKDGNSSTVNISSDSCIAVMYDVAKKLM